MDFERHCREGKLPNYVVIEQRYFDLATLPGNDDHPSHDVSEGQKFIKQVYEALRSSPQWNQILFLITYDEHGGFFDHVPPPSHGVPNPDGRVGPPPFDFKFDRLGVRVPTVFVSPWIEAGTGTFFFANVNEGLYFWCLMKMRIEIVVGKRSVAEAVGAGSDVGVRAFVDCSNGEEDFWSKTVLDEAR